MKYAPFLLVALCFAHASPASADDGCFEPARVTWQELEFRARKLGISADASLSFSTLDAQDTARSLTTLGEAPLMPGRPSVELLLGSGFLGRTSMSRVWLDSETGRAYERRQVDGGKRQRVKVYRFGESKIASRRTVPVDREERDKTAGHWTGISETSYPKPAGMEISEPSVLFYLISTCSRRALERGHDVLLFSSKQVSRVTIKLVEETELAVDYEADGERRKNRIPALRLTVNAQPIDETADSDFELLGLEGAIDLYIEEASRLPLQVSGRISPVGKVTIKLMSVTSR